jgi:hypothetical protein
MENDTLSRRTYSVGISLAICSVVNAAVVIAKESSKNVADWMQRIAGHHWTTHVLLVLTVFIALGWLINRKNTNAVPGMSPARLIGSVVGGVGAGVVIILGFYLFVD